MGSSYPPPAAAQLLHRGDRLMERRNTRMARKEYQAAAALTTGLSTTRPWCASEPRTTWPGRLPSPGRIFAALEIADSEAAAERLYYLAECARRRNDDEEMMSAVQQLAARYKQSPWRLKALTSAANRYLLQNRPQDYVPLYQSVYQDFPTAPPAAVSHWKVTFQAYLHDREDARRLLREHCSSTPAHSTAGAALYFLGRQLERSGDVAGARACYRKLAASFENHYYAMLARERLKTAAATPAASPSAEIAQFVAGIRLGASTPVAAETAAATQTRIERSRLLRSAGLERSGGCRTALRNAARTASRRCSPWNLPTRPTRRTRPCGS